MVAAGKPGLHRALGLMDVLIVILAFIGFFVLLEALGWPGKDPEAVGDCSFCGRYITRQSDGWWVDPGGQLCTNPDGHRP